MQSLLDKNEAKVELRLRFFSSRLPVEIRQGGLAEAQPPEFKRYLEPVRGLLAVWASANKI